MYFVKIKLFNCVYRLALFYFNKHKYIQNFIVGGERKSIEVTNIS